MLAVYVGMSLEGSSGLKWTQVDSTVTSLETIGGEENTSNRSSTFRAGSRILQDSACFKIFSSRSYDRPRRLGPPHAMCWKMLWGLLCHDGKHLRDSSGNRFSRIPKRKYMSLSKYFVRILWVRSRRYWRESGTSGN